jgi:Fe-S-cluster containining protein
MGHCNQCGKCCEAIMLPHSPEQIKEIVKSHKENNYISDPSWEFALNHWHVMSKEQAFKLNPYLALQKERVNKPNVYFYACDKFGKKSRLCLCHDIRPPVCINYPWYNGGVEYRESFYSETCGFKEDQILRKE